MHEFLIPSASGSGGLLFFDRSPFESDQVLERFWVCVTDHNLSATGQVWAGYNGGHPALLFANMASKWSGWPGELKWSSMEGELTLSCTHDRLGHIAINVEIRSGHMSEDWRVLAAVKAEAGQLEDISRRAASFFGREW